MSWLNINQSLNSLKGQITSFATEVLSEVPAQESSDGSSSKGEELSVLLEKCKEQEVEIVALKKHSDELQATLQSERLSKHNGIKEEDTSWNWDTPANQPKPSKLHPDIELDYKNRIQSLQAELSALKDKDYNQNINEEITRLKEENKNLTMSLEDLDNQHQLAMEKLLTLKKELQKNFEVLKQEHEDLKNTNDEYSAEIKDLQEKVSNGEKENSKTRTLQSDLDTLHHKYQNLERVHSVLKETTEKFQEENQDLHEEVFKLQEQLTKLEHEMEVTSKHSEMSDLVPRDRYEVLLKELTDLRDNSRKTHLIPLDDSNIDDNAKHVIENLKREIGDLKHKLAQKHSDVEPNTSDPKFVKSDVILYLYDQYVNFELPVDYVWNIPSTGDNTVMYKLEGAFKTLHEFKKDIEALENSLVEKGMNEKRLQTQIDELSSENDLLSTDVQTYYSELSEMRKNNDFLLAEITAIKNASKLQPIIETHEDNLVKLESELADSNQMNKTFQTEIKRIEKELSEVRIEKVSLEESLTDLKNKYNIMMQEIETYKIQHKQIEELENEVNSEQLQKLNKATDEISVLNKRLLDCNSINEQLNTDLSNTEYDKSLLIKQLDDLNNELASKNSALEQLHSKNEQSELYLKECENKLNEAENKIQGIINENKELKKAIEELQKNKELFDMKFKQNNDNLLTEKLDNLTKDYNLLHDTNLNLSQQLQTLQSYIRQKEANITKLNAYNIELETLKKQTEEKLSATHIKLKELEEQIMNNNTQLHNKDSEIHALNLVIADNKTNSEYLKNNLAELENALAHKENEVMFMQKSIIEAQQKINETDANSIKRNKELALLTEENNKLQSEQSKTLKHLGENQTELLFLKSKLDETESKIVEYEKILDNKNKEIDELNKNIIEIAEENKCIVNATQSNIDATKYNDLVTQLQIKENEYKEILSKTNELERLCEENKLLAEQATKEKGELINLITVKHNESIQYHNEIQRLNNVLLEQSNEFKKRIEEKNHLLENQVNQCPNCEKLKNILKEKEESQTVLKENVTHYETIKAELITAKDVIDKLTEKFENLDKNFKLQLETVKVLGAERLQLAEKEQNLSKELERLRRHLMETEENYTQELMSSEQKLQDCMSRLHQVEERHKQTSNVYTSNSIRANQEVETIRNQMRLVEKQRDDYQAKLSEIEDQNNRCNVALTNLQLVLEQFQQDKEREIYNATEKIRNQMAAGIVENDSLRKEIERLNVKLNESLVGLQAANRLSDQLESKTAQVNDLKEQAGNSGFVNRPSLPTGILSNMSSFIKNMSKNDQSHTIQVLQSTLQACQEKYINAVSNQQDRVDKNLVKNLVLNYVQTAKQNALNRTQVLRVLSTVLDFNQQECERLGLVKSLANQDSLAQEFVKFLEKESRPSAQLPPLPTGQITSRSNTPNIMPSRSVSGTPQFPDTQTQHKRNTSTGSQNLLLDIQTHIDPTTLLTEFRPINSAILDSGVTQTRNNEGAILKQVLKDT